MKTKYKLLRILHSDGSVDKSTGIYIDKSRKEWIYKEMTISIEEIEKIANILIDQGYLSAPYYRDPWNSKLVITGGGSEFVVEYINKGWRGKTLHWAHKQSPLRPFISIIVAVGALAVAILKN